MPVKFDSAADVIGWVSTGPVGQPITSFCVCGLGYIDSNNGASNQNLALVSHDGTTGSVGLVWRGVGDAMQVFSVGNSAVISPRPALNTPFFWYLQCAGSGANQVSGGWSAINDVGFASNTVTLDAGVTGNIVSLVIGGNGVTSLSGQLAAVRVYIGTLTSSELDAEQFFMFPQKLSTTMAFLPLWDAATYRTDLSGNGYTLDDLTGPGLTVPSNGDAGFPVRIRKRRANRFSWAPTVVAGANPFISSDGKLISLGSGRVLRVG